MSLFIARELQVDVCQMPRDRIADDWVADDEVNAVLAGPRAEVFSFSTYVEVKLIE